MFPRNFAQRTAEQAAYEYARDLVEMLVVAKIEAENVEKYVEVWAQSNVDGPEGRNPLQGKEN